MRFRKNCRTNGRRARRGMTTLEALIAGSVGSVVALSALSLTIVAGRMQQSVSTQQSVLREAKVALERINREVRLAASPLRVRGEQGEGAARGNRVEFNRPGEERWRRAFELLPGDGDFATPWDNQLVFDPDTTTADDEEIVATGLAPLDPGGAFGYAGFTTPLEVSLRVGDPPGGAVAEESNRRTGPGRQSVEIKFSVAPRN